MFENLRVKLNKMFPSNKTLSDKKLRKNCNYYFMMQMFWLFLSIFALPMIIFGARAPEVLQSIAMMAAGLSCVSLCLAQHLSWRIMETELKFELRLREALDDAANNKSLVKA
jgi:hypothetical protein